jgi:hypothetical protein
LWFGDWSSDVCSSDLGAFRGGLAERGGVTGEWSHDADDDVPGGLSWSRRWGTGGSRSGRAATAAYAKKHHPHD